MPSTKPTPQQEATSLHALPQNEQNDKASVQNPAAREILTYVQAKGNAGDAKGGSILSQKIEDAIERYTE
ncbi:hypothetical protein H0H92_008208 [Tricholoma furcatifolium]|nr:hypothetical protein H0H92_008208 [Tricholoma furcatifolium]